MLLKKIFTSATTNNTHRLLSLTLKRDNDKTQTVAYKAAAKNE